MFLHDDEHVDARSVRWCCYIDDPLEGWMLMRWWDDVVEDLLVRLCFSLCIGKSNNSLGVWRCIGLFSGWRLCCPHRIWMQWSSRQMNAIDLMAFEDAMTLLAYEDGIPLSVWRFNVPFGGLNTMALSAFEDDGPFGGLNAMSRRFKYDGPLGIWRCNDPLCF